MRLAAVLFLATVVGCHRRPAVAPRARVTIASTVPSVTDLIVGMGASDRLVAVSTYDAARPDVGGRPKAGDYQTIDWEQLAAVRPSVLVTATAVDRLPAGFARTAASLGISPLNVQVNRLDDLDAVVAKLGAALKEPDLATRARRQIDDRLSAVERSVAHQPRVPALVALSPDGTFLAGPGTYLDDVLCKAGGANVAVRLGPWPKVDREALLSLRPAVVIQLVPGGPQEEAAARATWTAMPWPATPPRVCVIAGPYVEQPGWHLPELAEKIGACLHPLAATRP